MPPFGLVAESGRKVLDAGTELVQAEERGANLSIG